MNWWLKSRAWSGLAPVILATTLLGLLAGEAALPVPVLAGASGTFLVAHLIPVLPAAFLLHGYGRTDTRMEHVASRPMRLWNVALALAASAGAAVASVLAYLAWHNDITLVTGRNIVAYIALAVIGAFLLGPRNSAVVTTVIPLAMAATGWTPAGDPEPWAWVLHPARSTTAATVTLVLLLAAAATAVSSQSTGPLSRSRS
ncbi:hypothetical protein [Streptomyces sp. SP18CS02]|uniref:hypothetical protein n=1 Tax=Streptomyces sp. SP18CS02 TaxID=3002531 RepID=UPI002E79AF16|nr:hypothetical protein [Streptomyces sp. SP18CS02]MEE1751202.1 hypothetical protein [Streptomyces sp. SP18CS02]